MTRSEADCHVTTLSDLLKTALETIFRSSTARFGQQQNRERCGHIRLSFVHDKIQIRAGIEYWFERYCQKLALTLARAIESAKGQWPTSFKIPCTSVNRFRFISSPIS